jgi:hypothetical protein
MRRCQNLRRVQLRSFENEFERCWGRAEASYASQFSVNSTVVWDFSRLFFANVAGRAASGVDGCVGGGNAVDC